MPANALLHEALPVLTATENIRRTLAPAATRAASGNGPNVQLLCFRLCGCATMQLGRALFRDASCVSLKRKERCQRVPGFTAACSRKALCPLMGPPPSRGAIATEAQLKMSVLHGCQKGKFSVWGKVRRCHELGFKCFRSCNAGVEMGSLRPVISQKHNIDPVPKTCQ